jgi:hypothetical protein
MLTYVDLEAMERYECDAHPMMVMMVPVVDMLIASTVYNAMHAEDEDEDTGCKNCNS